jgi:hypothetical protein
MSHIVIWNVAYLLTGLSYVTRDAKEAAWNRPRYVETAGGVVGMLLTWPLVALAVSKARAVSHIALFAILGGIGEVIRQVMYSFVTLL